MGELSSRCVKPNADHPKHRRGGYLFLPLTTKPCETKSFRRAFCLRSGGIGVGELGLSRRGSAIQSLRSDAGLGRQSPQWSQVPRMFCRISGFRPQRCRPVFATAWLDLARALQLGKVRLRVAEWEQSPERLLFDSRLRYSSQFCQFPLADKPDPIRGLHRSSPFGSGVIA